MNSSFVASVGNSVITREDVSKRIGAIPKDAPDFYVGKQGVMVVLEDMIKAELLYQQAVSEGLQKEPSFKEKVDDFKKVALANMVLEGVLSGIKPVTEKEAEQYFKENRELFTSSEVRVSHILVRTNEDARQALRDLAHGKDFAQTAKKWSIDADSALKGGDIGFVGHNEILPELEQRVFSMKKGETSDAIRTRAGYHIIRITDKRKGKMPPFSKVRAQVFFQMKKTREKEAFDAYIETLKERYPVKIDIKKIEGVLAPESE